MSDTSSDKESNATRTSRSVRYPKDGVTWDKLADELEQAAFGVGMLDPHGEETPGLEALLLRLVKGLRRRLESD